MTVDDVGGAVRTGTAHRLLVLLAAFALLVGGPLAAAPSAGAAVPAPPAGYGFSQGAAQLFLSADDLDRELDAVSQTDAKWLRVMVDWSTVERTEGVFDWTVPDRVIGAARSHGLQVLSIVLTAPTWARQGGALGATYAPPADPATLGRFMQAFVARYPDVTHHEIWNEPNLPIFWGQWPNPGQYTALLKGAYTAIKAVQSDSTVVAAGLSPQAGAVDFVTRMYEAGAKGYFDAAAMHPYVFPSGIAVTPNGWTETEQIRSVMVANGDGAKQIWLTEMGAPTTPESAAPAASSGSAGFGATDMVSQEQQAAQIVDVLGAAAASGYCGPAFVYSVRDWGTSPTNREDNFGALLTNDWQPKLAASVLAG
ncbi:hypothetical protein [Rhodococcus gannanensis]|uniref:Glycoside hydrolase family 5 domain-containing protein n=1 Tax=Rhodococcus gannanensis TaxID=1960308 RepID=A0ABW4P2U0_9NOCA